MNSNKLGPRSLFLVGCALLGASSTASAQVDPTGRSILFVRGADGSGGLGGGSVARRTEHLSDINNTSTTAGNHGFGELAALLRGEGFSVGQWIESCGTLTAQRLAPHRIVVFGSNNRVYSAAEVATFHTWADAGGSALFMSDANWGPNFDAAPQSDNQFLQRYGLAVYQDSADGIPVLNRATAGRYAQPDQATLSGYDGVGGANDVHSYDGEGVSYFSRSTPSRGWSNRGLVTATGFQVRLTTGNGTTGAKRPAGPSDFALVLAGRSGSTILGHFDRNTFFNRNGTGSSLVNRDNRKLAQNLFRYLVSVPSQAQPEGVGCSARGGTPQITVSPPDLGRRWIWTMAGAPVRAPAVLLISGRRLTPPLLILNCLLYVDPVSLHGVPFTTDATGSLRVSVLMPLDLFYAGWTGQTQGIVVAPTGTLEATQGIRLQYGVRR